MSLTVADLMTSSPICVQPDDTLRVAWDWMEGERIRHLPVVDEDGSLVGLLSHRDLVRHALAGLEDLPAGRVAEFLELRHVDTAMVMGVETADPNDAITDAGSRIYELKLGCLPVVEGQRVVGILTESDFVRYVVGEG